MTFLTALWLLAISAVAAFLALAGSRAMNRRSPLAPASLFAETPVGLVFLFDGQRLVDATDRARALLGTSWAGAGAWARLMAHLAPDFPDLEAELTSLPERGRLHLTGKRADAVSLLAEWRGGLRRITLTEPHTETETLLPDAMGLRAQAQELDALRRIADTAPVAICRQASDGRILWANSAYMDLVARRHGTDAALNWPVPVLFGQVPTEGHMRLKLEFAATGFADEAGADPKADPSAPEILWFDCRAVAADQERIVFATPADATVRAEANLHNFLLTLARTFAHLPIGLAIFDQQRRLQMFNPALTDLTRLPVAFLSARPGLFAVMDAMREAGTLPEPRNYKAWRRQISDLESGTAVDLQETWVLADGSSYRFTARPQAEGTLALLLEDITDEMLRSRRHHAYLELGQSVIDAVDEAIAVFDTAGALVMSNAALARLWGDMNDSGDADAGVLSLMAAWQQQTAPDASWQRLIDFVATPGDRPGWSATMRLKDGRALRCRAEAVSGQATLVAFSMDAAQLCVAEDETSPFVAGQAPSRPAAAEGTTAETPPLRQTDRMARPQLAQSEVTWIGQS